MFKKLVVSILAVIVLATSVSTISYANTENDTIHLIAEVNEEISNKDSTELEIIDESSLEVASGECTETVNWKITTDNENSTYYTLLISGIGEMPNYTYTKVAPWNNYTNSITTVKITSGVTAIGNMAFFRMSNLENVTLADTIITIGDYAFYECITLANITGLENINYIGRFSFYGCASLSTLSIKETCEVKGSALEFLGDSQLTYNKSRSIVNTVYNYLNTIYINQYTNLAFEYDYMSLSDKDILTNLALDITKDCTTEEEKVHAIYYWVCTNISCNSYAQMGFFPLDVVRLLNGNCVGQAQLVSNLIKLCGIPAVVLRGEKEDTTYCTLAHTYSQPSGHEWTMAYYNNDWYLIDTLWGYNGINNKDLIASQYFIEQVDGVVPFDKAATDCMKSIFKSAVVYEDGIFASKSYNEYGTYNCGSLSVGGGIRYIPQVHIDVDYAYYYNTANPSYDFSDLFFGQSWASGLYCYKQDNNRLLYIKSNGMSYVKSIHKIDNNYYYFEDGGAKLISEKMAYWPFYKNAYMLQDGQSIIDCFMYTDNYENIKDKIRFSSSNSYVASVSNDGIVTMNNGGITTIYYYYNDELISGLDFYVQKEYPTNNFIIDNDHPVVIPEEQKNNSAEILVQSDNIKQQDPIEIVNEEDIQQNAENNFSIDSDTNTKVTATENIDEQILSAELEKQVNIISNEVTAESIKVSTIEQVKIINEVIPESINNTDTIFDKELEKELINTNTEESNHINISNKTAGIDSLKIKDSKNITNNNATNNTAKFEAKSNKPVAQNALMQITTTVFNKVKALVNSAIKFIKNIIK